MSFWSGEAFKKLVTAISPFFLLIFANGLSVQHPDRLEGDQVCTVTDTPHVRGSWFRYTQVSHANSVLGSELTMRES